MKRVLLVLLGLIALFFGVRGLVRALASDETKIRWLVEDMTEGFNDTRMNPILSGLAEDFVDDTSGYGKDYVRAGLAQLFLERKDPLTKRFPFRAHVPEAEFVVLVQAGEPRTAKADFRLECDESKGEEWQSTWKAKVHAELVLASDGWKIHGVRIDTSEGRRPR